MAIQVFNVLTEFRFEIGSALLGTKKLQTAVDGVSQAADDALLSFQRLGVGIVAQFGLGTGGVLGALQSAVKSSESFRKSQLALSTALALNLNNFKNPEAVDTFSERLAVSKSIMEDINREAAAFALPSSQLLEFTKLISPILLQKGFAGNNLNQAITLSRNLLKAAPTLGIDPALVEGQLMRTVEGGASSGDPLFRRLMGETSTFKEAKIKDARAFNALTAAKRFNLLFKALDEFAQQADEVKAQTKTLTAQFTLLADALRGPFSILKPLGDVLRGPLVQALTEINRILRDQGAKVIKEVARFMDGLMDSPREMIIDLIQVSRLADDVKRTGKAFSIAGLILFVPTIVKFAGHLGTVGKVLQFLLAPLNMAAKGIELFTLKLFTMNTALSKELFALGFHFPVLSTIAGFFNKIVVFASRLLVPLTALLGIFQIFSRTIAIAKVKDAERLIELTPKFAELLRRTKEAFAVIFSPIQEVINATAEWISPLFQVTFWLEEVLPAIEGFVALLESIAETVLLARAGFEGLMFAILQFLDNIRTGNFFFTGGNVFEGVGDAFNAGIDSILEKNAKFLGQGEGIANQVVNFNGGIKQEFNFKENIEPDRVAFTVEESLRKMARNPTQAKGRSFNFNGVGGSW